MNKKELKIRLIELDVTMSAIADNLGVSKQSISQVISRRSKSRRIAEALAGALKVPIEVAFPDYVKKS